MEAGRPGDSIEARVQNLDSMMSWAHALSSNLRRFRSVGFDAGTLQSLQDNAEKLVQDIHARQGWDLPPRENPRIQPME